MGCPPAVLLRNKEQTPLCVTAKGRRGQCRIKAVMGLGRVEGSGVSHLHSSPDFTSSIVGSQPSSNSQLFVVPPGQSSNTGL
jgi:hypothetical protein